jgi:hypothetical protein
MREAEIQARFASVSKRMAMLIDQLEFVQMRQQATEAVLAEISKPVFEKEADWLKDKIDAKHAEIKMKADAEDAERMAKPKLLVVNGNGLHAR